MLATASLGLLEYLSDLFGTAALIMLYTVFILLGRQTRKKRKERKVTYAVEHRLKVYISWKFLISAVTGVAVAVTLLVVGCDLAAVFGILTFLLNFIPTVGPQHGYYALASFAAVVRATILTACASSGLLLAVLLPLPVVIFAPYCYDVEWQGKMTCGNTPDEPFDCCQFGFGMVRHSGASHRRIDPIDDGSSGRT